MIIECLIKRPGGTVVEIGSVTYRFTPPPKSPNGPHTCEVTDSRHVKLLLRAPEAYVKAGTRADKQATQDAIAEAKVDEILAEDERILETTYDGDGEDGPDESFEEVAQDGLVEGKPAETAVTENESRLVAFLDRPVAQIVSDLDVLNMSADDLGVMREAESANKKRKSVVGVIDMKLADMEAKESPE